MNIFTSKDYKYMPYKQGIFSFPELLVLLLAYFAPIQGMVICVFVLFTLDWITGIWKSFKFNIPVESCRLRDSIEKIFLYVLTIVSTYVMEHTFLPDWSNLTMLVSGYIAWTELTSIYENVSIITNKQFLKDVAKRIKEEINSNFKL